MWLRSAISFLLCALTFWAFSATIQAEPTFQANLSLIPGGASEAFSSSSLADGDSRDGAVLRLKYPVSPEHNYLVEYRDTFSPGSWCGGWSLLPAVPHNEGELSIPVESASRFFRVHELEGPRGPLFVTLQNDTGVNRMDRYTADASIAGWIEPSGGLMDLVLSDLANPGGSISLVNLVDEKSGHFTIAQQSIEDSFGSSLGDGEHRFQFQAIDLSGNVSTSKTLEFVLDQTSPVLDIFSPNGSESSASDLYFVDTEFVSIGGWTEPGLQLKLTPGGIEATADEEGSFVFAPVRLSPGSNLFTVSVRDLACNITSRTINLDFGAFEEPEPAKHSQAQALEFNPDWVVGETGGSSEKRGRIGLEDFKPFFESGDSTLLTLEMGFTVPAEASELRIGFSEVSLGSSTENTIRDAFEVILVDEAGNSLVHPIRPGARSREAFFNQTEGLAADIATRAGWDNETKILSLNLAALEPGTEGRLVFRLLSNQQDSRSRVALSGIEVRSGVPVMALSTVAEPVREREPLDPAVFAALQDISAGTEILLGRTSYDARSGTLYSEASLRNATNIGYGGPVVAVVQVLEDPSVRVRDADGLTPEGLPYFHLKSELSGGFGPNQISDNFEIAFFNPEGAPIRFNLKVLALLNRPPVFTGSVPLEVLAGNVYQAYAEAIDPDADPLDFALVSGPAEMTVGALDGAINWLASEDDLGRHSITIRVSDGRGGSDLLEFDLLVRSADSANRPPVFTGLPASAASSEFAYTSTAKAEDPDQDTLTYILVEGPAGLEMDSSTGALTWSPSRSQIGLHAVRIRAEDDRGGSTESEFQISVADFENRAPVITSEPRLRHNLPAEPNAPFGNVAPNGLFLNLEPGESATAQVSIDLPLSETIESGADIVFIVDESGSMAGEHEWLSTMVPELEAALLNFDISPNRYFLAGFTANPRFWNSGTQFHAEVFDPGMRSLGATTWGDVIAEPSLILGFAESGTHTISLEALAGSPSSTYQVRASLAVDSTDVDVAGFDTVFTGTIAPGESIFLPFSGAAGTMVFHDAQDVSSLSRRILAPDGSTVKDLFTRTSSAFTLPVSGDYLIRLWNQGSTERDYRFRLLAASASLPVGTRFDGVLISGDGDEAGRSAEVFRYDGAAGSRLFIQPHVAGNGNFALFDSSGLQLDLGNFNFDSEFEIPLTGSYLFVVYGNDSDAPVPYEFLISESSFETSVISADTIVDTDIAVPGEIDRFAFEGTQGQLVFFDGIASESTQFRSSMIHETGLVLFANAPRSFRDLLDDSGPFFLPRDGTYWITVDGLDEHVGDYAFQILNLSSDLPDIPFDETLSVALNPGESTVAYEFDGSAGERIFADVVAADGRLDWKLYTPSGDPVFSGSPTDTAFKLSETGRHVLLFDGESESDPGVYEIRFRRSPPAAPVAAATNTDIVGTLTEPGEILRYDFVLGKGDRIFFDGRSSDSGDIQAEFRTSYADVLESNRSLTADGGPHTVTESSLHSLFVEAGDSVGEFRYALLKAVDLTSPSVQTGSLGPREAILFRFEGSAGQLLELRDLNNIGTGAWFVYDPFNDSLVSSSFGDDISRVLESDGEHLLLVRANSSTTGVDYDFS
ncbi:MAG: Ig-like domain-containing protein, partial [Opitutales bacterium]